MAWTSRGLRGSTLEEMINRTNEQYRDKHLALIQKVPTPITPIKIDKESRHITLAYFEKKSTVDYIGAVQGIPSASMPKECKNGFLSARKHPRAPGHVYERFRAAGGDFLPAAVFYGAGRILLPAV